MKGYTINESIDLLEKAVAKGGGKGGSSTAADVSYVNTSSGLSADNVQEAIDELKSDIPTSLSASAITFDNTGTSLSAANAQAAIVEVNGKMPGFSTTIRHIESVTIAVSGTASATIAEVPGTIIGARGVINDSGSAYAIPEPSFRISFPDNVTCRFDASGASSWSGDVYLLIDYIPTPPNTLNTTRKKK